ncbi:MAG: glycosyltransferase family 9 protein [Nitrosomonadales bacterium]|nr:MAG: glycosyltransferase family 9 protein [Nitrosomonadales bacterium]
MEPDAKVLAIIVARIGDTLLVTPALRAIRQAIPDGHLTCLAHPKRAEVLRHLDFIDTLGTITKYTAFWQGRLGGKQWDYAVVYGHDQGLIQFALRVADQVVAFAPRNDFPNQALWKTVPPPVKPMHAVYERLLLAEALGISTDNPRLAYQVTQDEATQANSWLKQHLPPSAAPLIGLQLASFPSKAYRDWPTVNFVQLGRRILDTRPDTYFLILGGPDDKDVAEAVTKELAPHAQNIAGCFSLRESAALMHRLDLYIGLDTGPTHLAGALGIPMVAMYHCRHRGCHLAPLQHEHLHVIEHPATDAECSAQTAMSAIGVDQVLAGALEMLDRGSN